MPTGKYTTPGHTLPTRLVVALSGCLMNTSEARPRSKAGYDSPESGIATPADREGNA